MQAHLQQGIASGSSFTGVQITSSQRTTDLAAEDWGITFVGVPHLRLINTEVSNLPLSSVGPLLQCSSCPYVSIVNVTIAKLAGTPVPDDGGPPSSLVYGALHATGLVGANVMGLECSDVHNGHGWACLLLAYSSTGLAAQQLQLVGSSFTNNSVVWPGLNGSAVSIDGNAYGLGAIVVQSLASASTAEGLIVSVVNSTSSGNIGGCGASLAVIGNGALVKLTFASHTSTNNTVSGYGGDLFVKQYQQLVHLNGNFNLAFTQGSTLTSNQAGKDGGAVYVDAAHLVFVLLGGSHLMGNNAFGSGGAVFCFTSTTIASIADGSGFEGNSATQSGGAIYSVGAITGLIVESSVFVGNIASSGDGGALWGGEITNLGVSDSSFFRDNIANGFGGAIFSNSGCTNITLANNSFFWGNNVTLPAGVSSGGAIFCRDYIVDIVVSNGSGFWHNNEQSGDGNGGAIYTDGDLRNLGITGNSSFVQNSAAWGGAILCGGQLVNLSITNNSSFIGNDGRYGFGGAIYTGGSISDLLLANNSSFRGNHAGQNAGAIYCGGSFTGLTVVDSSGFWDNAALGWWDTGYGGAIRCSGNLANVLIANHSGFWNNGAPKDGGAIDLDYSSGGRLTNLTLTANSSFGNNSAGAWGGAIHGGWIKDVIISDNSSFWGNKAGIRGGAIECAFSVQNILVTGSSSFWGNRAEDRGGALSVSSIGIHQASQMKGRGGRAELSGPSAGFVLAMSSRSREVK
ncbi:putative outer membrane protein pmp20 [Tetrabaena socialis]|uniref:Putative outer membrane protein pmp20 n=1 Tax=Tetrabaena socialis TaxID=47790 RepID=A0A2J8ACI6_9CHLO|nr:putative outer membrane protein pmp20 [Tetrabaena socialis]|eukprot:PNH10230.1 putative outer membrane protein pmp20 [Tetrabaena socialis]